MIAKELKKSLLLAAISGKLTTQNENDSVRLIYKEKEIINENTPFELPSNWIWTKLGVIGVWKAGSTPSRSKPEYYRNGTIPWLKTGDLNNSYINEVPEYVTQKALDETSLTIQPKGAVLIAMYGATIGKLGILNIEATTNQACCACIVNDKVDNKYLFYYLMAMKDEFIGKGVGGAQPNISKEKIINSLISIPPIEEQIRIVEKLDKMMSLIDSLEKDENKLNELMQQFPNTMKASILQAAIQGRLIDQILDDSDAEKDLIRFGYTKIQPINLSEYPFDIPNHWTFAYLSDLVEINTGLNFKKEQQLMHSQGIRVLRGGNIVDDTYNFSDSDIFVPQNIIKVTQLLRNGDIITPSVTSLENIGKCALVENDYHDVVCGGFVFNFRPKINNVIFSRYLHKVLLSDYIKKEFQSRTNKSGQAFYNLGKVRISNVMIPIPPFKEQKRIIEKINEILKIVAKLNNEQR
ncbi:MAG: restriction endonuclease subunit S [Acholeplasmataceae bacterium]|jgi:type I restriction enzyme S subunit|nr:restriction endonuclease subunit S [Acholeplasmataceae bacterium]